MHNLFLTIPRKRKRIRIKRLIRQACADEALVRFFDHRGGAAGVDFDAGDIGAIFEYAVLHVADATAPIVFGGGLGEHGDEFEVGVIFRPLHWQVVHIDVGFVARAPVQGNRAFDADVEGVFDDAFDRREAGAGGEQDNRLVAVLT